MVKKILSFILTSKRSNYSFSEKIQIFRFLCFNYFKRIFSSKSKEVTQNIFGYKVTAFDYNALQFLLKEVFVSNEYHFIANNQNPKIIDCGANIGMSILYFKKLYPDSSIIAFEPNPHAFRLLEKNVKQNNLTNVYLYNLGLSNINGELDFFLNDNKGSLVGSLLAERGGDNKIVIETKKLSSFINDDSYDLIKIDVEGAEIQIFEDLIQSDKISSTKQYIIEYHHKIEGSKSNFSTFVKLFEDNNFEYNIKTNFNKLNSFQDILINAYKIDQIKSLQLS